MLNGKNHGKSLKEAAEEKKKVKSFMKGENVKKMN